MSDRPLNKFASSGALLSIAFALVLLGSWRAPAALAPAFITFESLPAPGNGTGGVEVRNQFAANGVIFQPVAALDYSQGIPIPNFAHSGTKAVELCRAIEFCTGKLDVSFTTPQRRVKIWAGYASGLDSAQAVVMRAFDANNNQVASNTRVLGPSGSVIPISTPLEVTVPSATIVRVTAGFVGAEPPNVVTFNNGLAFDDLEFDNQGAAPQCPSTQPPTLNVSEPVQGRVVIQNAFTVDANLVTADPFATLQVEAHGQLGAVRTFGPTFVAAGRIQIFNLSGLLFPGQNTVFLIVKDCAGTRQVTRTVTFRNDVTRTNIRVINESGANVQTARVYANGNFLGLTDAVGVLSVSPPLAEGTRLVARKVVAESSIARNNHSQGSNQNWKFRVYISNMAVRNDGTLSADAVNLQPDPNATQVLRVLSRNALIGLHLVASTEWDASQTELDAVRQKLLAASKFLYNATDGQIFIEQAEVVDDAKYWDDADIRVYADQSLRAYVDPPRGGFFLSNILFFSSRIHVQIGSGGPVYAHEFGHYGFDVGDEYKDNTPSVQCTALLSDTSPSNPFRRNGPSASCMMFHQSLSSKLCSGRGENPHVKGTRQGDASCWSTLAGHYRDSNSTARWLLQTPDTRGLVVPTVNGGNLPLNDMTPRLTFENAGRLNLCRPIEVHASRSNGTPDIGREIWLSTTYGADILQGKTNAQGNLTGTGIHVGDRVGGLEVKFENCTSAARLRRTDDELKAAGSKTIDAFFSQFVEAQASPPLELPPPAFGVFISLKPTKEGAQVSVSVENPETRQAVALSKPPSVKLRMRGSEERPVALRFDAKARGYAGAAVKLPDDAEVEVEATATDGSGRTVQSVGRFQIVRPDPAAESDVMSSDGQLTLTIPAKGVAAGTRVSVGPPPAALPALPDGYSLVGGPFAVLSFPDRQLSRPATLRFQMLPELQGSAQASYDSLRVFYFDGQKWTDLGGVVHPPPIDIVTAETTRLGTFALVGMPASKTHQQFVSTAGAFGPAARGRFGDPLTALFR